MKSPRDPKTLRRWLGFGAAALAGLVGGVFSFDFGRQISGLGLGLLLALNGAVCCAFIADAIVSRLLAWLERPAGR